jgi:hypothetical protein
MRIREYLDSDEIQVSSLKLMWIASFESVDTIARMLLVAVRTYGPDRLAEV